MIIGSRQASHLARPVTVISAGRPICRCMSRQAGLLAGLLAGIVAGKVAGWQAYWQAKYQSCRLIARQDWTQNSCRSGGGPNGRASQVVGYW